MWHVYKIHTQVANPLTNTSQVNFYIPVVSKINLELFSISGERVVTLAQGNYQEGNHQVNISPDNIKAGVYIIHMSAAGETINKKIVILN